MKMKQLTKPIITSKYYYDTAITLIFLLMCRLVAMYFIPLNDSTEARYAEIARKMLETGNWVTPMHDYGVPFWGKPPLSFWMSAFSMKMLGVNEFAARLPSLFISCGVVWLVWKIAKKHSGSAVAMTAALVLTASFAFIIDAGAVMTDPSLLFCTTLTMVAFWQAVVEQDTHWRYVFFIALGLGLLAKGPVVIILTGSPIFVWILFHNKWRDLWENLPWIKGVFLMLLVSLPWYFMAEIHTPGFLNYFIVGEHLGRFLQQGWQGDKYGFAHAAPHGMIWVYALIGIFPWTIGALIWLVNRTKKMPTLFKDSDGWLSYWLLNLLVPLIFFTFATNIIWPYILPMMPAFALLFAEFYHRTTLSIAIKKSLVFVASISGFILLIATVLFVFRPQLVSKSQKPIIMAWHNQHPSPLSNLIYWTHPSGISFSGQFYSAGRIKTTLHSTELKKLLSNNQDNYIVINSNQRQLIPTELFQQLTKIIAIPILKNTFTLYRFEAKTLKQ